MPFVYFLTLMGGNAAHDGQQENGWHKMPKPFVPKKIIFSLPFLCFEVCNNWAETR